MSRNPFYGRMHALAVRMLTKFGGNATRQREVTLPFEPGGIPEVSTETKSGMLLVVLPSNSELRKVFEALTNGPTVTVGELIAYATFKDAGDSEQGFEVGDKIDDLQGNLYTVRSGTVYNPDGQGNILHVLEVSK